jgi:uncharacterized protein (TIGR03437 family)
MLQLLREFRISVGRFGCLATFFIVFLASVPVNGQTITTVAGNGTAAFVGDGAAATLASLNTPKGLNVTPSGTLYIADTSNSRIRMVSAQGIISTVAGNGIFGYSGDSGLAVNAGFSDVLSVVVDAVGNLYIADPSNRRIRKVDIAGIVTTIAGIGVEGFTGDNGPATSAEIGRPTALVLDSAGNLYFADSSSQRVRVITTGGIISTIAGNGLTAYSGDGGAATSASLNFPLGIARDTAGNVYVADTGNNAVRKITPGGVISTVAGTGHAGFSGDSGLAAAAQLNLPSDVAFDPSGNLYIADSGNNRIRKVDTTGVITTVAGTGSSSFSGDTGSAINAALNHPWGLAIDTKGDVFIADDLNSRVRLISAAGASGPPSLPANSTINAASFAANMPIAPGSDVAVFGSAFSSGTFQAAATPLPSSLENTRVTINGVAAPMFFVSPGQANVQVPFNVPLGTATIQVINANGSSATQLVTVASVSPGIFMYNASIGEGVVVHGASFSLVTSSSPAHPGEVLAVYCTGLGPVNMAVQSGSPAPDTPPFALTQNMPTATIGNASAFISFSGLAPDLVGVYQINFQVPANTPSGNQPLVISTGGYSSNTATVPVSQ